MSLANPFNDLWDLLAVMDRKLDLLEKRVAEGNAKATAQWEPISVAMKRRRKSRATLLAAVNSGEIERRIEPCPGGEQYLLKIEDLDRLYPVRT